jgi:hypothetical protein
MSWNRMEICNIDFYLTTPVTHMHQCSCNCPASAGDILAISTLLPGLCAPVRQTTPESNEEGGGGLGTRGGAEMALAQQVCQHSRYLSLLTQWLKCVCRMQKVLTAMLHRHKPLCTHPPPHWPI